MTSKDRFSKFTSAARAARSHPYIRRVVEDPELRDNLVRAADSARNAYGRFSNGKGPTSKTLLDDKKLQQELRNAAEALRDASASLRSSARAPRRRQAPIGRLLAMLLIGGLLALAFSEELRSKVLDLLFGAEEEFDYSPEPSSNAHPPEPVPMPGGAAQ